MEFYNNELQKIKNDRNISTYELALEIGVSNDTLYRYLKGNNKTMKKETLEKIEKFAMEYWKRLRAPQPTTEDVFTRILNLPIKRAEYINEKLSACDGYSPREKAIRQQELGLMYRELERIINEVKQ